VTAKDGTQKTYVIKATTRKGRKLRGVKQQLLIFADAERRRAISRINRDVTNYSLARFIPLQTSLYGDAGRYMFGHQHGARRTAQTAENTMQESCASPKKSQCAFTAVTVISERI
jgi:hypothetical protein